MVKNYHTFSKLKTVGSRSFTVSLLSAQSFKKEEVHDGPKDNYGLVKIVLFFFALACYLPLTFFVNANDYWMFKLRNTNYSTVDVAHRTTLQAYFASSITICRAIPITIVTLLALRYGHKIDLWGRLVWTYGLSCFVFVLLTIFVKVDTDNWQVEFFVVTMILMSLVQTGIVITSMSLTVLLARLPLAYIKWNLYGQGCSGLASAVLQIVSLAIGDDSSSVALIYFSSGTVVILITLIFAVFSRQIRFYNHHVGDTSKDKERPLHTFKEYKDVAMLTWPALVMLLFLLLSMSAGHPNITNLVVSEYQGNGNPWNDKYFIPVVTYLLPDLVSTATKYFATPLLNHENAKWIVLLYGVKTIVCLPIYMFCNARKDTERHLPMLFPHDWEYILIVLLDNLFTQYLTSCMFMSIPRLTDDKEKTHITFMLITAMVGILGSLTAPLSTFWVKLM